MIEFSQGRIVKPVGLKMLVLYLLVLVVGVSSESLRLSCHGSVGAAALPYLSTKRPYTPKNTDVELPRPEGCSPVKLWYFGRHGTRYPGDEDIIAMQGLLPGLVDEISQSTHDSLLCEDDEEYLLSWRMRADVNLSMEAYLHEQGRVEIQHIGERFKTRYPKLFGSEFRNDTHYFRSTDSERTVSSLKAFASGVFSNDSSLWFPEPVKDDPILKFYSVCPKWEEEVDKNPDARAELHKFVVSSFMNDTISRVSMRLGIGRNLTLDEISIVYTTCAFETAWMNGTLSPWCVLFSIEEFKIMNYKEDLEYYYVDGYGHSINWQQACVAIRDAVEFLDEYVSNPRSPGRSVQAYFSHSGATLKILARLGLFNGTEITSDNFESVKDSYVWRTSDIDCMGSNMAFVLLRCDDADSYEVGLVFNEGLVRNWLNGPGLYIPYQEFRKRVDPVLNSCDFNQICGVK